MFVWYCRLFTRNRIFVSDYNQTAWWHTHTHNSIYGGAISAANICFTLTRCSHSYFCMLSFCCSFAPWDDNPAHQMKFFGHILQMFGIPNTLALSFMAHKRGIHLIRWHRRWNANQERHWWVSRHKEIYIEGLTFSLSVILYRKWTKRKHEKRGKIRKACGSPSNQIHFKNWL